MKEDGGHRRILPPPRRRASVLDVAVRWRVELLLLACAVGLWELIGSTALGLVALVLAIVVAAVPNARVLAARVERTVVIPHRVRSGLLQAGVVARDGRLPWIIWARPCGTAVLVHVWLRAGTTVGDVEDALPLIASACGSGDVRFASPALRPDRVIIAIGCPRWGRPR